MSDPLEKWEEEFDESRIDSVEETIVDKHDGSVVNIPTCVAATTLGLLMDEVETDIKDGRLDTRAAKKLVLATYLDNAVSDDWNGYFSQYQ